MFQTSSLPGGSALSRSWRGGLTGALIAAVASIPSVFAAQAANVDTLSKTVKVDGLDIFYREAGPKDAPVVLLLHGFPSSSHMYRNLIPRLATHYRVIAPDYPGFGYSSAPTLDHFAYTFGAVTDIVDHFTQAVGAKNYVLFMQDYGGPVGFRLAVKHPERLRGLIIQNAVANVEGWNPDVVKQLSPFWVKAQRRDGKANPRHSHARRHEIRIHARHHATGQTIARCLDRRSGGPRPAGQCRHPTPVFPRLPDQRRSLS